MSCSVNTAEWDVVVIVDVRDDASILVDEVRTPLVTLTQTIEQLACGKRVRIDLRVWSPDSGLEAFLDEVRAIQAQVRRVRGAVLIGYQAMPAASTA